MTPGRRSRRKVLIAVAAVVLLVVVGITLGVVFTRSDSTTPERVTPTGAAGVQMLFRGIPQHGTVLGRPSAPVTMIEYVDLQNAHCQHVETQVMPTIIAGYVRTGRLKVKVRPIASMGSDSQRGRAAVLAAGMQNKLFNFMHLLYLNQGTENTGWLDDAMVKSVAARIQGLDVNRLLAKRNSKAVKAWESTFDAKAGADGAPPTPRILIAKSGKKPKLVTLNQTNEAVTVAAAINAAR